MNFQYIGQMKQKLVYCCSEGYFVSQEYENIRKATRKEERQIEARYGRLENYIRNMRISERQQERKKGRLARYGRLENYIS